MIVYCDKDHKCHTKPADGLTPVDVPFFDGKCDYFIEGYCYVIGENSETGSARYPWKPYEELDAAQRQYEIQLLTEKDEIIAELDSLVLNLQYNNLIAE